MPEAKKLTRAELRIQRPLQILEAAFEEFTKMGFAATRVEDIADRVGVTKGTIYLYFETKEKLFESMIEHISAPIQELLETSNISHKDPAEELQAFIRLLYGHLVDNRKIRELLRFIVAEGPKFPELIDRHYEAFMSPVFSRVEAILDKGVAMGRFRDKSTELPQVVIAPVIAMVIFHLIFNDRRTLEQDEAIKTHLSLLLRGLLLQ